MDRSDFTQGMSHSDAMSKGKTLDNMGDHEALQFAKNGLGKLLINYNELPNRIDFNRVFVLTKEIADEHWLRQTGAALFVNVGNIDLPGITTSSFSEENPITPNFIWGLGNTGRTYGSLTLTLLNSATGEIRIGNVHGQVDEYDFGMDGRVARDAATWVGRPGAADAGTDFPILGYGRAAVPVRP